MLENTLVADNYQGSTGYVPGDIDGTISAGSLNNLIADGTNLTGISNGSRGNMVGTSTNPINPLIGPLGNFGGPYDTVPLLPGSPAIDAGSNGFSLIPTTAMPIPIDARGIPAVRQRHRGYRFL